MVATPVVTNTNTVNQTVVETSVHVTRVHRLTYYGGGADVGAFGDCNAFLGKLDQNGDMLWITLMGGPNYGRIYGVVVDSLGYAYVAGRMGPGLEVTTGVPQPLFAGVDEPTSYGKQNAFIGKFGPNGGLIWITYLGTSSLIRDIALSPDETFLAAPFGYYPGAQDINDHPNCAGWGPAALVGAYQDAPASTSYPSAALAIVSTEDGSVSHATYLTGNAKTSAACSVSVAPDGNIVMLTSSTATDLEVTAGCLAKVGSLEEFYLCKFNSDLSDIIWGTYLGSTTGSLYISTHNLVVDDTSAFVVGQTIGTDMPTTVGAYQEDYPAGMTNTGIIFRCRLSDGVLTACTYFGGSNGTMNMDGLSVDATGKVWISGATSCTDLPDTADAYQPDYGGGVFNAFIMAISNDLTTLSHCSYLGGTGNDDGRCSWTRGNRMIVGGSTTGTDFPTHDPYQAANSGGNPDAFVTIFDLSKNPVELIMSTYLGASINGSWTRDAYIDEDGYFYIAGGTMADNFVGHD